MIDLEQVKEKAENILNFYLDFNWEFGFIGIFIIAKRSGQTKLMVEAISSKLQGGDYIIWEH